MEVVERIDFVVVNMCVDTGSVGIRVTTTERHVVRFVNAPGFVG